MATSAARKGALCALRMACSGCAGPSRGYTFSAVPRPSRSTSTRLLSTNSPPVFGSYDVLDPATAIEVYPEPLDVPESIPRPPYVPVNFFTAPIWEHEAPPQDNIERKGERIRLGTDDEVRVRAVAKMAAEILTEVGKLVRPGITTEELDEAAHGMIVARGAYPSPLGYSAFPKSCTTSVNNIVAHGIPDDRPLRADDIVNIDLTIFSGGYHGDTSATFCLPETDTLGRELVAVTEESLERGIEACGPGKPYSAIGAAIENFARSKGFGVNQQFTGHGIGKRFHQPPWILHYRNVEAGIMTPGDCFTIEPPLVQGMTHTRGTLWEDGWTVSTDSKGRSAQFEHQVLITETGVDVLTRRK